MYNVEYLHATRAFSSISNNITSYVHTKDVLEYSLYRLHNVHGNYTGITTCV